MRCTSLLVSTRPNDWIPSCSLGSGFQCRYQSIAIAVPQQSANSRRQIDHGPLGTDYREYLVEYLAQGKRGHADLCAYFFLQASQLERKNYNGDYVLRKPLPFKRWIYGDKRPALYSMIAEMKQMLSIALTSCTCAFAFESSQIVFSHATGVIAFDGSSHFAMLQSSFHVEWAFAYGSSMKGGLRYTPSDCFETFPFPENMRDLNDIGECYDQHRQSIMLSRREGPTKTYNRFHNPQEMAGDIVRLRTLHKEMDEAVARAYGWDDLALGHGFHETKQGLHYTISEAARGAGSPAAAQPRTLRGGGGSGIAR